MHAARVFLYYFAFNFNKFACENKQKQYELKCLSSNLHICRIRTRPLYEPIDVN